MKLFASRVECGLWIVDGTFCNLRLIANSLFHSGHLQLVYHSNRFLNLALHNLS
jgi:hypothetical protein